MRHRFVGAALVLVGIAAACSERGSDDDASSSEEHVVGGHPERAFEAAGYLVREGFPSCSAVLVEPDLVLTAGHCVAGHQEIDFGWGEVADHRTMRSIVHAVHPRYIHPPANGGVAFQGFDVALLRLALPVDVTPAPLGSVTPPARVLGVGYGATSYVAGADGGSLEPHGVGTERRALEGSIRGESPTELFVRFDAGSSACYGDSGGPLFTPDGTVVGVLSRFTELGRCLPKDRSFMGYVRVDAMKDFFREALTCMRELDVETCLRDDRRNLCAKPEFETRSPATLEPSDGDVERRSRTFQLAEHESRTVTVAPKSEIALTLDSDGDARMRLFRDGSREPIASQVTHVVLEGGRTYAVEIASCNGKAQSVVLRWHGEGAPPVSAQFR